MDGLLLDTEPLYRRASASAAADLGYEIDDSVYASLVGREAADVERLLFQALGEDFPMTDFRQRWRAQWAGIIKRDGIALKPGALDLLSALRELDMPVAIATSTHRDRASTSLEAVGLGKFYDQLVCGDEVTRGKPEPDIYLHAARLLGVEAARCLALEDSRPGVHSASAAGMRVIMVPDLTAANDSDHEHTWLIADSLTQVLELMNHS